MWRILFLLNYIIICSYASDGLPTINKNLIVTKFDLIIDEDIGNDDPRIKSIIYSANSYKPSKIIINYVNPNAEVLANKLAQILINGHLQVVSPQKILSIKPNDNKYVEVIFN